MQVAAGEAFGGQGAEVLHVPGDHRTILGVSDVVFESELVKQAEVYVDYVLMLVRKYLEERGTGQDKEIRAAIDSSPSLRNKNELIEQFVDSLTDRTDNPG